MLLKDVYLDDKRAASVLTCHDEEGSSFKVQQEHVHKTPRSSLFFRTWATAFAWVL